MGDASLPRGQGDDLFSDHLRRSMSTDPESRDGFGPYLAGVGPTYKDQEGTVHAIRYGYIEDFKCALDYYGKNVAAFLVEPIQGEAGYVYSMGVCGILLIDYSKYRRPTRGVPSGSAQTLYGEEGSPYL